MTGRAGTYLSGRLRGLWAGSRSLGLGARLAWGWGGNLRFELCPPHLFAQLLLSCGSYRLVGPVPGGATCDMHRRTGSVRETGRPAGCVALS